jgi:hypothetical protein
MSKAPLLLRSSPAQGTGSYGAFPVTSLSSSPEDTDGDNQQTAKRILSRHRSARKNPSKLRHTQSAGVNEGPAHVQSQAASTHRDSTLDRPQKRRKPQREHNDANENSHRKTLKHQCDAGLESRFVSGSAVPAAARVGRIFELPPSGSNSSTVDTDSSSQIDENSEQDSLLDKPTEDEDPSDNSPYAQVRAAVRPTDDTSLSINTPRMWFLSILFAVLGSSTNLFFSLRYPSVSITPVIALLLVHPLGLLWDQILKRPDDPSEIFLNGSLKGCLASNPRRDHENGSLANGNGLWSESSPLVEDEDSSGAYSLPTKLRLWFAQGRWNEKEHCCVYVASNVSFGFAFATDVSPQFLE